MNHEDQLVSGEANGELLEIEEIMLQVNRGAWPVVCIDEHGFPVNMEQLAFCQQAQPTVKA